MKSMVLFGVLLGLSVTGNVFQYVGHMSEATVSRGHKPITKTPPKGKPIRLELFKIHDPAHQIVDQADDLDHFFACVELSDDQVEVYLEAHR